MKFLHMSDVHLGCTRYQLAESPRDFFDSWVDALKRYAIGEKVDFVLMCGDFFHKRTVPPETMDYAVEGLKMLKRAGIPVVTIEGNHDQKHTDSDYSWLRSLAKWQLLCLLEPIKGDEGIHYELFDESCGKGGYMDIGRARIFGSQWYGASANWAMPMLIDSIKQNRREGAFHILMLHTDVEGYETHPIPALSRKSLEELRSVVDYVALGHTHKHFAIDNWVFNPGSIEITSISDYRETRGVFIVEVKDDNSVSARHADEYHHRPFQRLSFDVSGYADAAEITRDALEMVNSEGRRAEEGRPEPIIEITLRGILGMPNSSLELRKIRDGARSITGALHIKMRNLSTPLEVSTRSSDADETRESLERRVIEELIIRDNRYKTRADEIAKLVVGVKRGVLNDESPESIADLIAQSV